MATEYIGTFGEIYKLQIDGCLVPYLTATKNDDETWNLHLDERYGITATEDEINNWLWFMANAMAISAGYSCFGDAGVKLNPFNRHAHGISIDEIFSLNAEDQEDES